MARHGRPARRLPGRGEDKEKLETALAEAKADLESGDDTRLEAARQKVEGELHRMAEKLYKAQAEDGGAADSAPGAEAAPAPDDDVIDAEYTEEKSDS